MHLSWTLLDMWRGTIQGNVPERGRNCFPIGWLLPISTLLGDIFSFMISHRGQDNDISQISWKLYLIGLLVRKPFIIIRINTMVTDGGVCGATTSVTVIMTQVGVVYEQDDNAMSSWPNILQGNISRQNHWLCHWQFVVNNPTVFSFFEQYVHEHVVSVGRQYFDEGSICSSVPESGQSISTLWSLLRTTNRPQLQRSHGRLARHLVIKIGTR